MDGLWVVFTTVPNRETGMEIARHLVEVGLVACAQVLPGMASIYRWQGEVRVDAEHLLILKVVPDRYPELRSALVEAHPYTVPEIVALETVDVLPAYLDWARTP